MADKATIRLLPSQEFEITLIDDTVIKGRFNTWALGIFCEKKGLTLRAAGELLINPSLFDMLDYILSAVESKARDTGSPFSYNNVHAGSWVDQLGGIQGPEFTKLFNHASGEQTEQKKTEGEQS